MARDMGERWVGDAGTVGTVAVVGLGKIGLPMAARYAQRGWRVIGVDVLPSVIEMVNQGRSHVGEEPGLDALVREARAAGRLEATADHAAAAARADVVIMIVPIMLTSEQRPDYGWMDAASRAIGAGLRPGTLVIYETTLPVGDTRQRYGPLLEQASGLSVGGPDGILLAFSPERVFSGRILRDLDDYPKLVGGMSAESAGRAAAFYRSVLDAEVWTMGSAEAAEFAKLAETTYRDVNIALATEFARFAERVGVDILEVIQGANSQPYSHIHRPGIGVGGHCIPVYPHFLLSGAPDLSLVETSRRINDAQVDVAIDALEQLLGGGLTGVGVLVLGMTYRESVMELAYSRALPLISGLRSRGAEVWAYDPLMTAGQIERHGARPWQWAEACGARAVVTQTADPRWSDLDPAWLPDLRVVYDGRNSLRDRTWPPAVTYRGVGYGGSTVP